MKNFSIARRPRLGAALISLLALIAAACGSTLDAESQDRLAQGGGTFVSGAGDSVSSLPPGTHVNKKGQVVNDEGEVIGTVTGGGTSVASSAGASETQSTFEDEDSAAASGYTEGGHEFGPGVTRTHILVGYHQQNDARAGCEAAGTCSVVAGGPGLNRDFADWYNKHGGIAGRKIELVKYEYSSTDGTGEQINQQICTYFTQDHPVFAGIGIGTENFNRCVNRGGISLIGGKWTSLDAESFNANPYVYLSGGTHLTNNGLVQAAGLLGSNYFKDPAPARVGLLTYDEPGHLRAATEMEAALNAGGIEIAQQENIFYFTNAAELGRSDAEIQNAVLRFKTEGITHVMFLQADAAALPLFFLRHAQDQSYFPRYGWTTNGGPATLADGGGGIGVEKRNFVDSVAVGWFPGADASEGQRFVRPPHLAECIAIAEKYGWPASTTNEMSVIANTCDFFQLLKDGIEAGLPNITPDSFKAGVESLGRTWQPAGPHQTLFSPGSHDGASAYQLNIYSTQCECFKPSGPVRRFK